MGHTDRWIVRALRGSDSDDSPEHGNGSLHSLAGLSERPPSVASRSVQRASPTLGESCFSEVLPVGTHERLHEVRIGHASTVTAEQDSLCPQFRETIAE